MIQMEAYERMKDRVFTLYPYHDVVIKEARGNTLIDADGKKYLDLAAGQLCAIFGHSPEDFLDRVFSRAKSGFHLGNRFFSEIMLLCCEKIASVAPAGLDKVAVCNTGSEANEMAVRIAKAATGKHEVVGLMKGYYGCTHQMLSLSDYLGFMKGGSVKAAGTHRIPPPDCRRCMLGLSHPGCGLQCLRAAEEFIELNTEKSIAAFIVEPILGSGGIIVPPEEYFRGLKSLCGKYGALLIADEAQTGLGRTGRWFGMQHFGVAPDILVLSKSLGAGFPVAAVATTAEIEDRCLSAPLANMSSHSFDPFGCAVAYEAILKIEQEGLVEAAQRKGRRLAARLEALKQKHASIGDVRGRGLMIGVEIVRSGTPSEVDPLLSLVIEAEALRRGLVLGYSALSGVLRILPALLIGEDEIDAAVAILDETLAFLSDPANVDIMSYMPRHASSLKLASAFLGRL